MVMQSQKDIDWELLSNAICQVCDCDTIIMGRYQIYIPLCHLIYEMVKYPCGTTRIVVIQSQIDTSAPPELDRGQYLQSLVGKLSYPHNQDKNRGDLKHPVTWFIP